MVMKGEPNSAWICIAFRSSHLNPCRTLLFFLPLPSTSVCWDLTAVKRGLYVGIPWREGIPAGRGWVRSAFSACLETTLGIRLEEGAELGPGSPSRKILKEGDL